MERSSIELETIKPYKCGSVSLKEKYALLLTEDKFFDDGIVGSSRMNPDKGNSAFRCDSCNVGSSALITL